MYSGYLLKLIDGIVFFLLILLGAEYFVNSSYLFDVVFTTAVLYVMMRKIDVNTITLVLLILFGYIVTSLLFLNYGHSSGYGWYSTLLIINMLMVYLIWSRPVLVAKHGPTFVRHNKALIFTQQDAIMALLFALNSVLQVLMLLEHVLRHLDDIGLEGLFGQWNPMFVYDNYEIGQFGFIILELVTLYFMTFDKSKNQSKVKRVS